MLPNIGFPELILILVIALIIFGPRKLPEIGKAIGGAINEFKSSISGVNAKLDEAKKIEPASLNEKDKEKETAG